MMLDFKTTSNAGFNISVLATDPMTTMEERYTHIGCYQEFCFIDRSRNGNCNFGYEFCNTTRSESYIDPGLIEVKIIIDVSIIEVFICSETYACTSFTERVYSLPGQGYTFFEETGLPHTLHIIHFHLPEATTEIE